MNTLLLGFIGPQEIIIILLFVLLPVPIIVLVIIALRRKAKRSLESRVTSAPTQKPFNKKEESLFNEKDIKDYYPIKDGSKITLIQFDEIVDFSAANNFVFLTDISGRDYLVESTLSELEIKLPAEFIRIHKSTIINKNLIHEVKRLENGRYDLVMKCEKERIVSCSKNYNEKIKAIIEF